MNAPDQLRVLDRSTGRRVASWPLFERPAHVAVYGDLAIVGGASRSGLFAVRLSDGRIAQIGIDRAGDRPLLGPAGVLYQDDLDLAKHRTMPWQRTLKFVPLSSVEQELARPFSTVRMYMSYSTVPKPTSVVATRSSSSDARSRGHAYRGADPPGPFRSPAITAMSMDGSRVALAVRDPAGRCDYVLFWNVTWHYVTRLSRASGQTCLPTHAPGGITNVAIAGSRAEWTVRYGATTRLIGAVITDCQEWVIARPTSGEQVALAGDNGVLAYALASQVGSVGRSWNGESMGQPVGRVRALSAYDEQVAALDDGGNVSVMTRQGDPIAQFAVGHARAIALGATVLAALGNDGALGVYRLADGALIHSWKVAPAASSLDVQYGLALVTAGRDVYAVNLTTGRTARVFHAPALVHAQIEAPGAAMTFTRNGHGSIDFVPMSLLVASTS